MASGTAAHGLWASLTLALSACTTIHPLQGPAPSSPGAASPAIHIEPQALLQHIETLSSDAYEGRKPGTNGEVLTIDYLVRAFQRFGLRPGNADGT